MGSGRVRMHHGLRDKECPRCGGRGWIRAKPYFDRTKRLLEKHASSFTASQKAELRDVLK
jgi:hypothetical protein